MTRADLALWRRAPGAALVWLLGSAAAAAEASVARHGGTGLLHVARGGAGRQQRQHQHLLRRGSEAPAQPCTCDCCLAQKEVHASGEDGGEAPACAPRGAVARGAVGDDGFEALAVDGGGDGGCAQVCEVPEEDRASFESRSGEVDYARYCLWSCRPGEDAEPSAHGSAGVTTGLLCVGAGPDDGDGSDDVEQGDANSNAPGHVASGAVGLHAAAAAQADQEAADGIVTQKIALGELRRAKMQAESAGQAAHLAEEAYMHVLHSSSAMAEAAGKATMEEVQKEASRQAEQALLVRRNYEKDAQKKATAAAIQAAQRYAEAKADAMSTAGKWKARSEDFARAAGLREQMAMDLAATAEKYKIAKMWDMAKKSIFAAHQAMSQAQQFAENSQMATAEANNIRSSGTWYDWAAKAAAANALAKATPVDVPPPPMPDLR